MKKLLLSFMVLATLASCGKDNKVTSNPVPTSSSTAITINDSTAQQLGSMINSSESYFGLAQASYYETWNQAFMNNPNYYVTYGTLTTASASNNCEQKSGWLGIKYTYCKYGSSSYSSSAVSVSRKPVASSIIVADKRIELIGIINSTTAGTIIQTQAQDSINGRSYPVYLVRTTAGVIYTIDTRFPIQANPVAIQQTSGSIEIFLGLYR